jgi:twitching motility protein PilJ
VQIEKTSNELSTLIQDIAREADAHSQQAQRISELMDGIREVSVKTSRGTSHTADSVRELADLVLELQGSVSDFRLPGEQRKRADTEEDRPKRQERALRGPLS